jgi:hypothetical protein
LGITALVDKLVPLSLDFKLLRKTIFSEIDKISVMISAGLSKLGKTMIIINCSEKWFYFCFRKRSIV